MQELFDSAIETPNLDYISLRDDQRYVEEKKYCEELWLKFSTYAVRSFPQNFSDNLYSRFWELYLGGQLLDLGFSLIQKQSSKGPDYHLLLAERHVWIEAIAPEKGEGTDRVPLPKEHQRYEPLPMDRIILRFTNAISEKKKQFEKYIRNGVVSPDDAFVIAVNGGGIEMIIFDDPLPVIIKSVFGIFRPEWTIDVNTLKVINEVYKPRFEIKKISDSLVSTNAFLDSDYSLISGILYSTAVIHDLPNNPGEELLFIHNPIASVPMDIGWLGIGEDCFLEEGNLLRRRVQNNKPRKGIETDQDQAL